jgi:hypothetical protein
MSHRSVSFKRHVIEYQWFYILACAFIGPAWVKFMFFPAMAAGYFSENMEILPFFVYFTVGYVLVFFAGSLQFQWKLSAKIVLGIGLVMEAVTLSKLIAPARGHAVVALPLLISLAMSMWWVVVYFLNLSSGAMDREKNKRIVRRVMKYFVLCAVLLYGTLWMLMEGYFRRSIEAIYSAGNIDSVQKSRSMIEQLWHMELSVIFLLVIITALFFNLYRRTKAGIETQPQCTGKQDVISV